MLAVLVPYLAGSYLQVDVHAASVAHLGGSVRVLDASETRVMQCMEPWLTGSFTSMLCGVDEGLAACDGSTAVSCALPSLMLARMLVSAFM